MKLAIMQPYLFPYIGYYQLVRAVDRFVLLDDVTYIKQGWINRNRVLVNGEVFPLLAPVKRHPATALIKDVHVDDDGQKRWRRRLLTTIANAYRRAPHFGTAFPVIEAVIAAPLTSIADLAALSVTRVAEFLGLRTEFVVSSARRDNRHLAGQARVIDTCLAESAAHYVNAVGGKELYSKEAFSAHGIVLNFLESRPIEYRQFREPFVPWLSIVDVLMFNSVERVGEYLTAFELT